MGRRKRPHAPGMIFHLVSRTHRGEQWFVPVLRTQITRLINRMVGRTDAQLLAYAVMPNHLHVVLRQGQSPLGAVMQPMLRRVAHRVQRHHGFEGSVVERRYRDRLCKTADHVREVIMYTHLNPQRAGLCNTDLGYQWTTHGAYLPRADPTRFGVDPQAQMRVLELFAGDDGRSRNQLCRAYLRLLEWRKRRDEWRDSIADNRRVDPPVARPATSVGDLAWGRNFQVDGYHGAHTESTLADLRDFLIGLAPPTAPALALDELRGSYVSHQVAQIRRRLMRAATQRGYRTGEIARFFDVSPQTVSRAKYAESGP